MCGLLAHEKEGRLLDHDSNQREITVRYDMFVYNIENERETE